MGIATHPAFTLIPTLLAAGFLNPSPGNPTREPPLAPATQTAINLAEAELAHPHHQDDPWQQGVFLRALQTFLLSHPDPFLEAALEDSKKTIDTQALRPDFADDLCLLATIPTQAFPKTLETRKTTCPNFSPWPDPWSLEKWREWSTGWNWIDALYMEMPLWAASDQFSPTRTEARWQDTHSHLWSPTHQLYYRDSRFLGSKTFWARGNGWALAGLAESLAAWKNHRIPIPTATLTTFQQLAASLLKLQAPNGSWPSDLLHPEAFPAGDSSATALICYALLLGIENQTLPEQPFLPAAQRAWENLQALCSHNAPHLFQPAGGEPGPSLPNAAHLQERFASATFLLAASQIQKLDKLPKTNHLIQTTSSPLP